MFGCGYAALWTNKTLDMRLIRIVLPLESCIRIRAILAGNRELERDTAGYRQFDIRSGACGTRDFERSAASGRTLTHTCQTPVSLTSPVEHLRIDATTVVANPHAQVTVCIFKF